MENKFLIFSEKYRPQNLEDIILVPRIKNIFLNEDISQNYLFHGTAGLGKTTLAFILSKNKTRLYINVSDESSVDVIREKITDFCSTSSLDGNGTKIVILDEIDGASDQFFKALRATIEKYHINTKFIATCNYFNKLPDAIVSRFICLDFTPKNKEEENFYKKEYIKKIVEICKLENISYTKEGILELLNYNFPDLRKIVNNLQMFKIKNFPVDVLNVKNSFYQFKELFEYLINTKEVNTIKNYKYLSENYWNNIDEIFEELGKKFVQYIIDNYPQKEEFIPYIVIKIADYQSRKSFALNKQLHLLSLLFEIQEILNIKK